MPIYEFICRECSERFDKLVPFDWKSSGVVCPKCDSEELDKVVSCVGFSSGGKMVSSGSNSSCTSCSTSSCSTCNI